MNTPNVDQRGLNVRGFREFECLVGARASDCIAVTLQLAHLGIRIGEPTRCYVDQPPVGLPHDVD